MREDTFSKKQEEIKESQKSIEKPIPEAKQRESKGFILREEPKLKEFIDSYDAVITEMPEKLQIPENPNEVMAFYDNVVSTEAKIREWREANLNEILKEKKRLQGLLFDPAPDFIEKYENIIDKSDSDLGKMQELIKSTEEYLKRSKDMGKDFIKSSEQNAANIFESLEIEVLNLKEESDNLKKEFDNFKKQQEAKIQDLQSKKSGFMSLFRNKKAIDSEIETIQKQITAKKEEINIRITQKRNSVVEQINYRDMGITSPSAALEKKRNKITTILSKI